MSDIITLPRKKHSHRCRQCGQAVYCYKKNCLKPQRIEQCAWCRPVTPLTIPKPFYYGP